MLSTIFFLINEENLLKIITLNKLVKEKAATRPDILALFGLGNFNLIREKSVTTMLTTTVLLFSLSDCLIDTSGSSSKISGISYHTQHFW